MSSRVVIPQLELEQNDNPVRKVVEKGAKQVSLQQVVATSHSASSSTFSFQPPSQNTVLDRRIDLLLPVRVSGAGAGPLVFTDSCRGANALGTTADNYGFGSVYQKVDVAAGGTIASMTSLSNGVKMGNSFAPRQLPLASIISNIDITINGTHFTTDIDGYIHALMKYTTPEYREKVFRSSYHHPDVLTGDYGEQFILASQKKGYVNELAIEDNGGRWGEKPRGCWVASVGATGSNEVIGNVGTNANASLTFFPIEPLLISPLCMNYGKGMTNINNIEITLRYRANLEMAFSGRNDAAAGQAQDVAVNQNFIPANITVDLPTAPSIFIRNFTPQDDIRIPNEIILDYHQPRRFTTAGSSILAQNVVNTQSCSARRLDQIPEALYLYVKNSRATDNLNRSSAFVDITGVSITFGNQVGILSGHTREMLQELAIENGGDFGSQADCRLGGLVLKLVFGKDIPLMSNESPGTRGDYNITVEVSCRNPNPNIAAGNWEINELYVNNGQVIVSPNECRVQTGLLDMKDNIEAEDMGHSYNETGAKMEGGSLFSKVGRFFRKVPHLVKQGVKHLPQALETANKVAGIVGDVQQALGGEGLSGGSRVGGSLTGGSHSSYHSRRK